jgi:cell shape-determining protein MreC
MESNADRLPVYQDQENFENTKRKLDFTDEPNQGDVIVTKGGGG